MVAIPRTRLRTVLLSDLLGPVHVRATTLPIDGVDVRDLAYDSRRVQDGTLFFCVPGAVTDGHDHAEAAVAAGACALVVERQLPIAVPQVVVESCRVAMGPIADRSKDWLGTSDIAVSRFRKLMVDAAIKMRDANTALGRTQPHIPHASIASFEGVMPKTTDWRKINAPSKEPARMTAAE